MIGRQAAINNLPPAEGRIRSVKTDAFNQDIIDTIQNDFKLAVAQTKNIAKNFVSATPLQTAYNVWSFLKRNIQYQRDPNSKQVVRLPSFFINTSKGDCKSYSLFAASVLYNTGQFKKVCFRYACYNHTGIPSHVYVVVQDVNGNEIIVDGVYSKFNEEKQYTSKKQYCMEVYSIAGVGDNVTVSPIGKLKLGAKLKTAAKKLGDTVKKGLKGVEKVGLAPSRTAFLGLVALNVHGFGTKITNAFKKNPAQIGKVWDNLGGNINTLKSTAEKGSKRKAILGVAGVGIGIDPVTDTAALTTAAAPIIAAITKVLKTLGLSDKADEQVAADSAADYADQTGGDAVKDVVAAVKTGKPDVALKPDASFNAGGTETKPSPWLDMNATSFFGIKNKFTYTAAALALAYGLKKAKVF